jgi:hypothetical protein
MFHVVPGRSSRSVALTDNLQALSIQLFPESAARLEAATGFEIGFPHDFIADMPTSVFGEAADRVDQATATSGLRGPVGHCRAA